MVEEWCILSKRVWPSRFLEKTQQHDPHNGSGSHSRKVVPSAIPKVSKMRFGVMLDTVGVGVKVGSGNGSCWGLIEVESEVGGSSESDCGGCAWTNNPSVRCGRHVCRRRHRQRVKRRVARSFAWVAPWGRPSCPGPSPIRYFRAVVLSQVLCGGFLWFR